MPLVRCTWRGESLVPCPVRPVRALRTSSCASTTRTATILWTRQFGSPAQDEVYGIAVDAAGIYVAGVTPGTMPGLLPGQTTAGGTDIYVRKYDHAGNVLWTRQIRLGH